jgi:hypothetical protein
MEDDCSGVALLVEELFRVCRWLGISFRVWQVDGEENGMKGLDVGPTVRLSRKGLLWLVSL